MGHDPGEQGVVHRGADGGGLLGVRGRHEQRTHQIGRRGRQVRRAGAGFQAVRVAPQPAQTGQDQVVQRTGTQPFRRPHHHVHRQAEPVHVEQHGPGRPVAGPAVHPRRQLVEDTDVVRTRRPSRAGGFGHGAPPPSGARRRSPGCSGGAGRAVPCAAPRSRSCGWRRDTDGPPATSAYGRGCRTRAPRGPRRRVPTSPSTRGGTRHPVTWSHGGEIEQQHTTPRIDCLDAAIRRYGAPGRAGGR